MKTLITHILPSVATLDKGAGGLLFGFIILMLCSSETMQGRSFESAPIGIAPQIEQPIVNFLKSKEGYRSLAYKDVVGVWTIGYGHTGTARAGMRITKAEGEALLRKDARRFEEYVWKKANRPLEWNKFGALVSFCYNLGYRLKGDLLLGIQTGNDALVTYKMNLYVYAGGRVYRGLVIRRKEETEFYNASESIIKRYSVCN